MTGWRKKKMILPLAGLLLVSAASLGLFFYIRTTPAPLTVTDLSIDSRASLALSLVKQISKKNGVTEWELEAASASLLKEEQMAVLTDVRVIFFTGDHKKIFLTSDSGTLDTRSHDIRFTDNVIIRHETYLFRTDTLQYQKKSHIIISDTRVRLENDSGSFIEADSMEALLTENRIVLKGRVKGIFSETIKRL